MTTDTRIESLEAQVRTLKRMLFGVFGLVIVGGLLAATALQNVPDVIQAKKFEVVNGEGKVRASLFVNGSATEELGAILSLRNKDGFQSVEIYSNLQGGNLQFYNKDGRQTCSLKSSSSGGSMKISNNDSKTLVDLSAQPNGGVLEIRNRDGNRVAGIGANNEGNGLLRLANDKGETTTEIP